MMSKVRTVQPYSEGRGRMVRSAESPARKKQSPSSPDQRYVSVAHARIVQISPRGAPRPGFERRPKTVQTVMAVDTPD